MVKDIHPLLGVPADAKVIYKHQLQPCIIAESFPVFLHIPLAFQHDQFIQKVAVIDEASPKVLSACFHAAGREKIGLTGSGDTIYPDIKAVFRETEAQDLLNGCVIINTAIAGLQIFNQDFSGGTGMFLLQQEV